MKKLASFIDEIVATSAREQEKLAEERLFASNTPPTISTDVGVALMKTAALLKAAADEETITADDLTKFMEKATNA